MSVVNCQVVPDTTGADCLYIVFPYNYVTLDVWNKCLHQRWL